VYQPGFAVYIALELTAKNSAMLRAHARQKFIDTLERSYFGIDNFTIEFGDGQPDLVHIRFLPNLEFIFATFAQDGNQIISVEAPGLNYLIEEQFTSSGIEMCVARLQKWLDRVHEETISTNPFAREISTLRSEIDKKLSSLGQELQDFFTRAEAESLKAQLDAFGERLNSLSGENEGLQETIKEMAATIADLKSATEVVNKGTWLRMSSGRLLTGLKSFAKSKEVREFALDAAKQFLLPGPK
jgi:hypothetical protein